jgi:DNA-binding CsgD family transcriptional regulator
LEEALCQVQQIAPALQAQLAGALGRALLYGGAEAEARVQVARSIEMARKVGDPAVLASNIDHLFDFSWGPESTEELLHFATEMVAGAERSGDPLMVHLAHARRMILYLELGDMQAVGADLDAVTKADARIRQRTYSIAMRGYHLMMLLLRGEFAAAERLILEVMAQSRGRLSAHQDQVSMQIFTLRREQGRLAGLQPMVSAFLQQHAAASVWRPGLMLVYLEIGQREKARKEYEQLMCDLPAMPRDGRWHYSLVYLTEVCVALADAGRAPMMYQLMLPYAGRTIVLGTAIACCGSADRYLGLLAATMGRWPEAQAHFEAALAMNERIGARVPLAHTRHDYAAMLVARGEAGDRERAATLLRASLESAREIGMRALEERSAARLNELSGPSAPDDLTGREAEVLRLIAIGRSNADIAMALSISLNTVATHVRNILAKTGCANRTEAAAYAMRKGLAPH